MLFQNITSFEDLKSQYRKLAMTNHPDMGGNAEIMKAVNNEYDQLFPIWKHRSAVINNETSYGTRSEFYTQNGWKGENYNPSISTKEIACIIREYLKDVHNDYRFSVRSEYNHLYVTMTEAPEEVFTNNDKSIQINQYYIDRETRLTESARSVMQDIYKVVQSYNFDDSDSMIDYFNTNFYISLNVGNYDNGIKIVPRTKKIASNIEYETVTVTKTRTKKVLEPKEIEMPLEFVAGQRFILKASFNYGCYRGTVYEIDRISGNVVYSYKMGKGYRNVCKGDVRGNSFSVTFERLKMWVEKGAIAFVELVEVEKKEEYASSMRRPKIQTGVSTEVRTENKTSTQQPENISYEYTITQDEDTRDNSIIYVVKFAAKLSKEEYIALNNKIKSIGGYYSKFKHGFLFKSEPTEILFSLFGKCDINEQNNNEPDQAEIIAENIIDTSTEIINSLGLKYDEYANSEEYKQRLSDYVKTQKVNQSIIDKLSGYGDLQAVVVEIIAAIQENKTAEQEAANKQKTIGKINKQIESAQQKINALSGDYKCNTYKRMNEQAGREQKINGFRIDIEILEYLLDIISERSLTVFESALINGVFRDEIHAYYLRHEAFNKPNRVTSAREIKFPEIDREYPNSWWNKEVPTKQKRLAKAGIFNTMDLIKAAEQYKTIFESVHEHASPKQQRIKKMEREARINQKGDINFTPSEVAKRLVEYARINANSKVLEPSAGIGNIADEINRITSNIDVCEQRYDFVELLKLKGYNVVENDFLSYNTNKKYDAIIMNPPFSDEQNHIQHAFEMLKDGGTLVSITSPHWTFANDKNSLSFRSWVDNETNYTIDLPSGTFEKTGVASKILVIEKQVNSEQVSA